MLARIPALLPLLLAATPHAPLAQIPAGQLSATVTPIIGGGSTGPAAVDNTAVLPVAFANAHANSYTGNTNTPFASAPMQYQQVFLGSELPGAMLMTGIGVRRDDWQSGAYAGQTVDLEINLGFTTLTPATLTNTFASNFDSGPAINVLLRANVTLPALPSTPVPDPTVFNVHIPFTTPFVWPAGGGGKNLLLEIVNRGNSNGSLAFTYYLDAVAGSTTFPVNTAKLYGAGAPITGTVVRNAGMVFCFDGAGVAALHTHYGTGCAGTGGLAGTVVPASMAKSFGTGNNTYPFGSTNFLYQQVFLASEIPATTTPMIGMAWRQDNQFGGYPGATMDLEVNLGYTTLNHTTITTTFATNYDSGAPVTVVPRANVNLPPIPLTLPTDPTAFLPSLPFAVPFPWAPANGNLLLQLTMRGGSGTGPLDAGNGNTRRVWATSSTALTGMTDAATSTYGLPLFFQSPGSGPAVPWLTGLGRPVLGGSYQINLERGPASSPAFLMLGASNTSLGGLTLPFDLAIINAPGCFVLGSAELVLAVTTDAAGNGSMTLAVPTNAALAGAHLYEQFATPAPGANGLGLAFSRAGDARLGSF
jgi:hypothetical protein